MRYKEIFTSAICDGVDRLFITSPQMLPGAVGVIVGVAVLGISVGVNVGYSEGVIVGGSVG